MDHCFYWEKIKDAGVDAVRASAIIDLWNIRPQPPMMTRKDFSFCQEKAGHMLGMRNVR